MSRRRPATLIAVAKNLTPGMHRIVTPVAFKHPTESGMSDGGKRVR